MLSARLIIGRRIIKNDDFTDYADRKETLAFDISDYVLPKEMYDLLDNDSENPRHGGKNKAEYHLL